MRKVKLQMQLSIDGFVAGENGAMDWMIWDWDEELKKYVGDITEPVDCILLGRVLAQGFIPHWKAAAENTETVIEGAKKFNETPKVVFTRSLQKSEWENTSLAKGDLVAEIKKLKQQKGGDIMVYGGGSFVSDLIKENLIDEYHFFINPAIIGKGLPIFQKTEGYLNLDFVNSHSFSCGIVVNEYRRKVEK